MDTIDPLRFVGAFFFVIGLIGVAALVFRRYGRRPNFFGMQEGGRIQVVEVRYIDPRRKLVLIRRDAVEHLVLLADGRETVIESGIKTNGK